MDGIDIVALAQAGTALAFELAGTYKITVTLLLAHASPVYDPASDTEGPAGITIPDVEAIAYKARNEQQGGDDISVRTRRVLIEAAQLPAGTEITEKDTVQIGTVVWQIVDAMLDAEALWTLDLRR